MPWNKWEVEKHKIIQFKFYFKSIKIFRSGVESDHFCIFEVTVAVVVHIYPSVTIGQRQTLIVG